MTTKNTHEVTVTQYGALWEVRVMLHTESHLGVHDMEVGVYTARTAEKAEALAAELRKRYPAESL